MRLASLSPVPRSPVLHLNTPPLTPNADDRLPKYGWTHHDGTTFGIQDIYDHHLHLKTTFAKHSPYAWTARIAATADKPKPLPPAPDGTVPPPPATPPGVLYFYVHNEGAEPLRILSDDDAAGDSGGHGGIARHVIGSTAALGPFRLTLRARGPADVRALRVEEAVVPVGEVHRLGEAVDSLDRVQQAAAQGQSVPAGAATWGHSSTSNTWVVRVVGALPLTLEVAFAHVPPADPSDDTTKSNSNSNARISSSDKAVPPPLAAHDAVLEAARAAFDVRFETAFPLARHGYSAAQAAFARAALSNMVGGMGFWYGQSRVRDVEIGRRFALAQRTRPPPPPGRPGPRPPPDTFPYFPAALFSGVPSRSFFPRGFMWDEGFHQLLVRPFQPRLTRQVLGHWLDLMNTQGWIPREQILGPEARSRVPDEFVTQPSDNANPPTWFLVFEDMLDALDSGRGTEAEREHDAAFLRAAYPRLSAWFAWFNTQRGAMPGSFHWRGRERRQGVMNPLTLTSGLDDYPRATHPSAAERHVDLRCWMAVAARVLARIARLDGRTSTQYEVREEALGGWELGIGKR